jgi:hypothetical protein
MDNLLVIQDISRKHGFALVPGSPYFHVVLVLNGRRYQKSAKTASRAQAKAFFKRQLRGGSVTNLTGLHIVWSYT